MSAVFAYIMRCFIRTREVFLSFDPRVKFISACGLNMREDDELDQSLHAGYMVEFARVANIQMISDIYVQELRVRRSST